MIFFEAKVVRSPKCPYKQSPMGKKKIENRELTGNSVSVCGFAEHSWKWGLSPRQGTQEFQAIKPTCEWVEKPTKLKIMKRK